MAPDLLAQVAGFLRSVCRLATRAGVASGVARAEVADTVLGVVEVPALPDLDALAAACAVDQPLLDARLPPASQRIMAGVVPPLLPAASP